MKSLITADRWARIKLFAMDVDGILTDGTIHTHSDGTESKQFSVLDGLGLNRLVAAGIATAWISGRFSGATTVRANELRIPHIIQGRTDKLAAIQELATTLNLTADEIVYMGDDDIDAPAIRWAGIGVSVPDAMPAAHDAATLITSRRAGHGAVREICEHILQARQSRA
ncbi:KdsC family phosphatase [Geminisphaera colitermitum]|uniref:KdsC family phosphatase n=1 Tax=Geminisphaera colitermitum TaxID=1148786 RepID=UPI000158CE6C|nr:HAD hydrolase family protein [Geminisphaera colitermitum]